MFKDIVKQLLIAAATVIVPFIYSALANVAPGIPIGQDQFLQFVIWLLAGIIGGGALGSASANTIQDYPATFRTRTRKTHAFAIPIIVYAGLLITVLRTIF